MMTRSLELLMISRAVDVSEVWRYRVEVAFELSGVELTRKRFILISSKLASKLKFPVDRISHFDQETGEEHVRDVINDLGPIDDSDISDIDILTAVNEILIGEGIAQGKEDQIAALEIKVLDLENKNRALQVENEVLNTGGIQEVIDLDHI